MHSSSVSKELLFYDFDKEENKAKWKGLLTNALQTVLEQVNPSLTISGDALEYVEYLILRLLFMLCSTPSPQSIPDVDERVRKTFPFPIDNWAINDAKEALERCKKKPHSQLVLPVEKIHNLLSKEAPSFRIDLSVTTYIVAVLEYISADILKLAGNYVKNIRFTQITCQEIRIAMYIDDALMDLFCQDDSALRKYVIETKSSVKPTRTSLSYEELVKDFLSDEKQYLRDLHMIIKVFLDEIERVIPPGDNKFDLIFCNILDIYELTVTLKGLVEDVLEMSEEKQVPAIGSCFEELAEAAEFDIYSKYAADIVHAGCYEALSSLIRKHDVTNALQSAGHGFRDAVKYYLPKLLLSPVWHCFLYFDYIKDLLALAPSDEDRESLEQVEGILSPLQVQLSQIIVNIPKKEIVKTPGLARRQAALAKTNELQRIEGWESKDLAHFCNELIQEGFLCKLSSGGRRLSERKVYLFDGVLVLCKLSKRTAIPVASQIVSSVPVDYRLKEKFFIRKIEIIDREDTLELKHAFEIAPKHHPNIILVANSTEEKNNWMADLIMLNTKGMLDRILDSILLDEEKKHPLQLPPLELYRFSTEDSRSNIVFEERENSGIPLIKGATLLKLIERLTYHVYADPKFVRTFLTTYRSFCSPQELLSLLEERFNVPDSSLFYNDHKDFEKATKNMQREDCKRYRKEYCQPIKFRVLNVLRHWVDHHYYDFERDPSLQEKLLVFLNNVNGKSMRKWVDSVRKIIQRKQEQTEHQREIVFGYDRSPPPIEWHIQTPEEEWNILTLHPVEIARQLTLLHFDLYKVVQPSELVESVWTKRNKQITSPNLLSMIKHTTDFTRWLEKSIVQAENIEERVAIVSRIIEILIVLQELNNFNGVLAVVSAMGSASVYRLKFTFQKINVMLEKALEEARDLTNDHYRKYLDKLRSINPPCVPFCGIYLTNILHIEEGNPDYLPSSRDLINFSKRRKVAEITGEIQQYQNQPYYLSVEPRIRRFLETLTPFEGMTVEEISSFLYNKSLEVEPRDCHKPPRFSRQWPFLSLKSPGIKIRKNHLPQPLPTSISPHIVSPQVVSPSTSPRPSESGGGEDTPRTPLTAPHTPQTTTADYCVFNEVTFRTSDPVGLNSSVATNMAPMPPPLPPRKIDNSTTDASSTTQNSSAPSLPPRVPPRQPISRSPSIDYSSSAMNPSTPHKRTLSTASNHSTPKHTVPNCMPSTVSPTRRVTNILRPETPAPKRPPKPPKFTPMFPFNQT